MPAPTAIRAFWSYSHADNPPGKDDISVLRETLHFQLNAQAPDYEMHIWQDANSLRVGENWKVEAKIELENSRIFFAMMSPQFLSSQHCCWEFNEFKDLMTNDSRKIFVPIIYRAIDNFHDERCYDSSIKKYVKDQCYHYAFSNLINQSHRSRKTQAWAERLAADIIARIEEYKNGSAYYILNSPSGRSQSGKERDN